MVCREHMVNHRMLYFLARTVEFEILFGYVGLAAPIDEYVIPRLPSVRLRPVSLIPRVIGFTKIIRIHNHTVIIVALVMDYVAYFKFILFDDPSPN